MNGSCLFFLFQHARRLLPHAYCRGVLFVTTYRLIFLDYSSLASESLSSSELAGLHLFFI